MEKLTTYLPFLVPVILLQVVLAIAALMHVLKHQDYRWGNRNLWIVLVLFLQIIGPVLYFTTGRGDQ